MMSEWFDDLSIPMDIESGLVVITVSGQWFSTSVSGQHLVISSGAIATVITDVSGQTVKLESGTTVQLPSTQVVKTSGEQVVVASGAVIHRALLSGLQTIIGSISGQGVFLPATQVVKTSGETVVTTKQGTAFTIFSGYGATNTIVTSGFGFLEHERATIVLSHLGGGSGINYAVTGYAISGIVPYVITSASIYSGNAIRETISDPYSWISVDVDNKQDNFSGIVTVVVVRR